MQPLELRNERLGRHMPATAIELGNRQNLGWAQRAGPVELLEIKCPTMCSTIRDLAILDRRSEGLAIMSDENQTEMSQDTDHPETRAQMVYESNPKHSEPWQIGRRGSLCEPEVRPLAAALLRESVLWKDKRYAIHQGKAYCAQEHEPDRWHGYPIGWLEVPSKLTLQWIREQRLSKRDRKRYWEKH